VTDPGMGAVASLVSPFPMSYIYNKIISKIASSN